MTLKSLCIPRRSTFEADRRATVLSLDAFLSGRIDGREFFEENYFTNGMLTLVDRAFRHLAGSNAGSSVFLLSQAMGGGKTHSMIALGLLARDPELRREVLGPKDPAPKLNSCRVIGFNGRNTDAAGGIWGSIAEQLGKAGQFARYVSPLLSAPGPEAWKQLLGGDPLVLFLDELPPYLEYAVAVPVGRADLGVVTTTALANLFVALAEMDNVCLVLSDLAGTNFSIGQSNLQSAFDRAVQGISSESKRIAVPITPVNPNGDELYHILRKRLFEGEAPKAEIETVAAAYRDALREAGRMNLTTTTPESLYARVIDAHPHADRTSIGLGFLPDEARHGFLIDVPKGNSPVEMVCVSEHRGDELNHLGTRASAAPHPADAGLRVLIDRTRWLALAPAFWEEANRRLRANGLPLAKFAKNPANPVPVHPSLGKELCVLCWAVEEAPVDDVANALRNWEALAPEERWWLFTMTVATTGQALQKGIGWRKALRSALADNPFVKGEGAPPRTRRELLGHSQLSLNL